MVGALDDPATYLEARVGTAALVATTAADTTNSNVAFTVREISPRVPIVATANREASIDILELAGADEVLQLGVMLGDALAVRILGPDARSHVIGGFADLLIAEAGVRGTTLVGRTLAEADLPSRVGVNVIGVWDRGDFELGGPDTRLEETSVLILAGHRDQLDAYDDSYSVASSDDRPVVIIGGGRVGRAVGRALDRADVRFRIVEQQADRVRDDINYVLGDAAALEVLESAGIREASSVVITTHDDDMNVYLALYCRKLRPDIQVIARANLDRNVSTLYRAGSDAVLSYASTGATAVWNHFRANDTLLVAEGLDVFRVPVPDQLAGRSLAQSNLRRDTGCTVVAVARGDQVEGNPSVHDPLPGDADLVLIGDDLAESRFRERYPARSR
jgi:Trk K+ transport system NAD-binding subunit